MEDLDRDGAIEPRVSAFVHLAHPTFADLRGDFVDAKTRARSESQECRDYTGVAGARARLVLRDADLITSL